MHSRAALVVFLLLAVPLAGCIEDGPGGTSESNARTNAWAAARDEHGPTGLAATFDLRGALHLLGELSVTPGPGGVTIAPGPAFPTEKRLLFVDGAIVEGRGRGLLVLEGERIHASGFGPVQASRIDVASAVSLAPKFEGTRGGHPEILGHAWEEANRSYFFTERLPIALSGVTLSNHTRAMLFVGSTSTNLTGPVKVSADALYLEDRGAKVTLAGGANVTAERFNLGGTPTAGELRPEGRAPVATPASVVGKGLAARLEPNRVHSTAPFRLTQALTTTGYLLPATVEVAPVASEVRVARGASEWLRVDYRERGYVGDAVLESASVTGSGKDLVKVPVRRPPTLVEEMWSLVPQSGIAAPFVAFPIALASPAIFLIDFFGAVGCAFVFCPADYPYPQWMDAGDVGRFYVKVEGNAPPGTYDAKVTLKGRNHDAVEFPVRIVVTG